MKNMTPKSFADAMQSVLGSRTLTNLAGEDTAGRSAFMAARHAQPAHKPLRNDSLIKRIKAGARPR